ncbi:hypothetical protein DY000_02030387 [Brassica cretica]|uniref:Tim10-like domain-containing protein n=1 Tax=Brassica cretica TaxID=69181 RepID=A0ABQ7DQJ7_BRACR|nr:hypothetical protein DY000_02030387 [Brassica cretica]
MFVKKPWKWTMDCWEVTGTWVNTKPAVMSPAKKKVVKEDSPRPRKKARKEAPAEASAEAAAEASEEVTTTVGGLTKEDIKTMFKDKDDAMREGFGTCLKEINNNLIRSVHELKTGAVKTTQELCQKLCEEPIVRRCTGVWSNREVLTRSHGSGGQQLCRVKAHDGGDVARLLLGIELHEAELCFNRDEQQSVLLTLAEKFQERKELFVEDDVLHKATRSNLWSAKNELLEALTLSFFKSESSSELDQSKVGLIRRDRHVGHYIWIVLAKLMAGTVIWRLLSSSGTVARAVSIAVGNSLIIGRLGRTVIAGAVREGWKEKKPAMVRAAWSESLKASRVLNEGTRRVTVVYGGYCGIRWLLSVGPCASHRKEPAVILDGKLEANPDWVRVQSADRLDTERWMGFDRYMRSGVQACVWKLWLWLSNYSEGLKEGCGDVLKRIGWCEERVADACGTRGRVTDTGMTEEQDGRSGALSMATVLSVLDGWLETKPSLFVYLDHIGMDG